MHKSLLTIGIVITLLGASSIISENLYVEKTISEVVPYSVQVSYTVQVPYTVEVPYQVQVEVTKTQSVVGHTFSLGSVTLKTKDFTMSSSQTVRISWDSSKDVTLFGLMKEETWNSLYWALIGELGISIVVTLLSGGSLAPAVIASMPGIIIATMHSIASGDYYKVNENSDVTTKNLNTGLYKLVVISFGSSGTLNAKVTYDYETMETQTRYRTETRYREEIRYRNETRYRTEERIIEEPLLVMPRFKGIEWNILGYATLSSGIIVLIASVLIRKKRV